MPTYNSNVSQEDGLDEVCYCADCSNQFDDGEMTRTNDTDDLICDDCSEDYVNCYGCSETMHSDNSMYSDNQGEYYCSDCYHDTFVDCNDCGDEIYQDDSNYDEPTGDYLCDTCYGERGSGSVDWDVYSHSFIKDNTDFVNPHTDWGNKYSRDSFDLIPSNRYVGIEIETNYFNEEYNNDISDSINHAIRQSRERPQRADEFHDLPTYPPRRDTVVSDGSVTSSQHQYGNEVVMSPRRGDILDRDVKVVTRKLKDMGGYVSRKCGLHIHIDVRDYDYKHFTVLALMTKLIEPHVYAFCPPSRLSGNWSKPVSQSINDFNYIYDRDSFIAFWYDNGCYTDDKYNDKRYHGLNLHCHFQANQGLEIRYHGGTLNADKIRHWTIFWTNVVDKCYDIAQKIEGTGRFGRSSLYKSLRPIIPTGHNAMARMQSRYSSYNSDGKSLDFHQYRKDSLSLQRVLRLENRRLTPYAVEPMLDTLKHRHENCFMSMPNMFKVFNIPQQTRLYIRQRVREIHDNAMENDINHHKNVYSGKRAIVGFDDQTNTFEYIDHMSDTLPSMSDSQIRSRFNIDTGWIRNPMSDSYIRSLI